MRKGHANVACYLKRLSIHFIAGSSGGDRVSVRYMHENSVTPSAPAVRWRTWLRCRVRPPRLLHPSLLLEVPEHAVQVVRLDLHLAGDLRCADSRVGLDQPYGLIGAGASAAPAAGSGAGRRRAGAAWTARAAAALAALGQVGEGSLELGELTPELGDAVLQERRGLIDRA